MRFQGVYTALVTPFQKGAIDYDALNRLVDEQIDAGITGIVPVGTSGESPTLEHDEHIAVIAAVCKRAAGRVQIIAGTGSNSTAEAIELTQAAKAVGANATLQMTPYYNRPSQEGIYRHICEVSTRGGLPVVLYNIPGRTGASMEISTIARMMQSANIVAIKEAAGSVARVSDLRHAIPNLTVLSGDDGLTVPMMSVGAQGVVSVASHIVPRTLVQMVDAAIQNDFVTAQKIHERLYDLFKDLFLETNPVPVKYALSYLGKISPELRLPLCEMQEENKRQLAKTLDAVKDLN